MELKHIISFCILAMGHIAFTACSSDATPYGENSAANSQLNVSSATVTFDMERSSTINVVASPDLSWEATAYDSWIEISKLTGTGSSEIVISTPYDNPQTTKRTGTVTLRSKRYNLTKSIEVTQEGTRLSLTPRSVDFQTAGGSETITVNSNASWNVSSTPNWISTNINNGQSGSSTIKITASANPNASERQGKITLYAGDRAISETIEVKQSPTTLTLNKQTVSFLPEGGSSSFNVTSNSSWKVSSNSSWCTVTPSNGSGNGIVNINVENNAGTSDRTATITVTAGNVKRTVDISQSTATLYLGSSSLSFTPNAASKNVEISSNTTWTAESDASWCTVTKEDNKISVSVAKNNAATQRTATITIKAGGLTKRITVTQEKVTLTLSTYTIYLTPESSSRDLSITTNTDWTASSNASWCTLSATSGNGNKTIAINCTANTNTARTATITVKSGELSKTVTITQEGVTLSLSLSSISFAPEYSSQMVNITTNTNWTASSSSDWCKLSSTSGSGSKSITVSAQSNTTSSARTATITVKAGSLTQTVSVTQAKATLSISKNSIDFSPDRSSTTVNITSNTEWSVSGIPVSWCTVTPSSGTGNKTITITAEGATTSSTRSGTLKVTAGSLTQSISISQSGVTLSGLPSELVFTNSGGSQSKSITSNATITATSNATSWCTVKITKNTGSFSTITVTTTANTSVSDRSATITVKAAGLTQYINVKQSAGTSFDINDYSGDTNMN